jgi:hypothetical protein
MEKTRTLKWWGGRRDLNPRQLDPQSRALTGLSYGHQPAHNLCAGAARVSVEGILDEFLDDGRRPLNHFAGGDLVGDMLGE